MLKMLREIGGLFFNVRRDLLLKEVVQFAHAA